MSSGKQPGVMLYFDLRTCLKRLTLEQKGALLDAILDYGETGIEPEIYDLPLAIAWDFVQQRIDRDSEAYRKKVDSAQRAARSRWERNADASNAMHTDADAQSALRIMPTTTSATTSATTSNAKEVGADKPPTRSRFTPPTCEQVRAYCQEVGLDIDAGRFVDFYESKNWKVGSAKMSSWKAAARNWARRDAKSKPEEAPALPGITFV